MRLIERKNGTFTRPHAMQITEVYRDCGSRKVVVRNRNVYDDGITYLELVKLEEFDRRQARNNKRR